MERNRERGNPLHLRKSQARFSQMKKLGKLSGTAFDQAFLEMMIKHHQGAVTMAKTEQAKGLFPEAKTLAGAIISSQSAEIITMQGLLKKR